MEQYLHLHGVLYIYIYFKRILYGIFCECRFVSSKSIKCKKQNWFPDYTAKAISSCRTNGARNLGLGT